MNDIGTWIVITIIALTCFAMGWNLRAAYEEPKRRGLEAAAQEEAATEYERGLRDGWEQGVDHGVTATRRVLGNQEKLTQLAARRFAAGGLRAHE